MRQKILYKVISFLLVISVSLSYLPPKSASAADWVAVGSSDIKINEDSLYWIQDHHAGDDDRIRYRTKYYKVSVHTFRTEEYSTSSYNASLRTESLVPAIKEVVAGDTKRVTYTISRDSVMEAANKLGVTPASIANGTAKVYLNPVYETFIGNKTRKTEIFAPFRNDIEIKVARQDFI